MKLLGENFTVLHVIYQSAYLSVPLTNYKAIFFKKSRFQKQKE